MRFGRKLLHYHYHQQKRNKSFRARSLLTSSEPSFCDSTGQARCVACSLTHSLTHPLQIHTLLFSGRCVRVSNGSQTRLLILFVGGAVLAEKILDEMGRESVAAENPCGADGHPTPGQRTERSLARRRVHSHKRQLFQTALSQASTHTHGGGGGEPCFVIHYYHACKLPSGRDCMYTLVQY
jgi:hypothetical protein